MKFRQVRQSLDWLDRVFSLSWSGRRRRLAKFVIQRWGVHRKEGVAQRVADFDGLGCWGDP